MKTFRQRRWLISFGFLLIVLVALYIVVQIQEFSNLVNEIPISFEALESEVISGAPFALVEEPGVIIISQTDDKVCGESALSGQQAGVVIQHSEALPAYVTDATVILDGWSLQYLNAEHHVRIIHASIQNVEFMNNTLTWDAVGYITDKNFDDAYEFCYYYTILGWNSTEIDALAVHGSNSSWPQSPPGTTALTVLASYIMDNALESQRTVAILPRGVEFAFAEQTWIFPWACFECPVDNEVLQIGYHVVHEEQFIDPNKDYGLSNPTLPTDASYVDLGYVSWESHYILKDNSLREDNWFREWVTVLAGDDIGLINPPFSILPIEDDDSWFSGCITGGERLMTTEHVIENIPFEYALPVLTGYDLGEGCDDKDVKEVGIWLHDATYEKPPNTITGTLRYQISSIFSGDGDQQGHLRNHNVRIIGLRGTERVTTLRRLPDLIPIENPNGGFCTLDDEGQLVITVRNIGNEEALPSVTTVEFLLTNSTIVTEMPTSDLPINTSTDLTFEIPGACFNADCDFVIRVDAQDDLDEVDEANNHASGECIG